MQNTANSTVMAFGTFDLFHAGHENYLQQAKKLGDYLVVIIARDDTVKKIKGHAPTHNEKQRLKNIKNSGLADKVVLGSKGDKHQVLKKFRPHVIALGYDQHIFTQRLEKTLIDLKLNASIVRMEPYFPQMYKSSLIRTHMSKQTEEEQRSLQKTRAALNRGVSVQLKQKSRSDTVSPIINS